MKKIRRFCGLLSWATVTVADADRFRIACGVTWASESRHMSYWKRTLDLNRVTKAFLPFHKRPKMAQTRILRIIKIQKQTYGYIPKMS